VELATRLTKISPEPITAMGPGSVADEVALPAEASKLSGRKHRHMKMVLTLFIVGFLVEFMNWTDAGETEAPHEIARGSRCTGRIESGTWFQPSPRIRRVGMVELSPPRTENIAESSGPG
jgi:hypothetical protein